MAAVSDIREQGNLADVLARGLITSQYQPIVELGSDAVVAYESLARGPGDLGFSSPDALFGAAERQGLTTELDLACAQSGLRYAITLPTESTLFLNLEPATLAAHVDRFLAMNRGRHGLVVEITERAVAAEPAALMRAVDQLREAGISVAFDDVGANPDSLAFLPLIRPEVVKLDMGLLHDEPDALLGRTMAGVLAYAERSGAIVLAEGIETDRHLEQALTLGATHGQGWRFGHPAVLPANPASAGALQARSAGDTVRGVSPFEIASAHGLSIRDGRKRTLLQISHQVEELARQLPDSILLSAFQDARHFTPDTLRRYTVLAQSCALVGAFGAGLSSTPAPGVRGVALAEDDPLAGEWTVVVLGPQYAAALVAVDLQVGTGPDREFRFAVTHRRRIVEDLARHLAGRLPAITGSLDAAVPSAVAAGSARSVLPGVISGD
jgi:EAL domain-containing protein (putative c-di-GMP-specific phosphodiesterase class I)